MAEKLLFLGSVATATSVCLASWLPVAVFAGLLAVSLVLDLAIRLVITYTLPDEGGASLRAAGFRLATESRGGSWDRESRPREDVSPLDPKWRWESP